MKAKELKLEPSFVQEITRLKNDFFDPELKRFVDDQPQQSLYTPISYIMQLGGKRLRPLMVLASTEAFGGDPKKALSACMSIEVFHNFTLMHDDIMDDAPLRRGKQTVHEKWGVNTGILSGDAMMIQAYQLLNSYEAPLSNQLMNLFNTTALEVCEGQQMDMEFEERNDVQVDEYLEMIRLKTSVLLAAALKMGAQIAGASEQVQNNIYNYGQEIGLAFQLRDDYLDAFGDPETFGKQVGGDILADKKTFLWLKAMDKTSSAKKLELDKWLGKSIAAKVEVFRAHFRDVQADKDVLSAMEEHYQKGLSYLELLPIEEKTKAFFVDFARTLLDREN